MTRIFLVIEVGGENTGTIELELLADIAPLHVERIKRLTRDGLYDDVVFHRVLDGFMAQTGGCAARTACGVQPALRGHWRF